MEKKATQTSIKQHNIGLILRNIKGKESTTRIKLNAVTGLAKSTISDLVSFLIDKKVLSEGKKIASKIGKKPIILKFNNSLFYIAAVNIGIGFITVAITDLMGEILVKIKSKNNINDSRENILNNIFATIDNAVKKSNINWNQVYLISIGTHGAVDPVTKVINHAPYFKNWSGINLYEIFRQKYKKEIVVENGVNLGAIGVRWKEYPQVDNLVYLNIHYGVGAGLLLKGMLETGKHGNSGEISYLPILLNYDLQKLKKNTLELGLFESQVDIISITNAINHLTGQKLEFDDISKLYKSGAHKLINQVIDEEVIKILAIGIATIITIIDTEIIVINGAIIDLGQDFIDKLKQTIYGIIPFKPKIITSGLKRDAAILGAIKYGLDYMDNLFFNNFFSIFH
ncbi:MAG: ROK family protein [Actinomycetota bacterium]|nr:ROK family protein [Actinomycetota bacterium]